MLERYYSNDGKTLAIIEGKGKGDRTLFCMRYNDGAICYEEHEIKLYKWARGLHGNAPSGTPYGYFRANRNGKRVIITV